MTSTTRRFSFGRCAIAFLAVVLPLTAVAQSSDPSEMLLDQQAPAEPPAMKLNDKVQDVKGSLKMARVFFVSPKDGANVKREFTAKFGIEGMKVAPAGDMAPGSGHFHVLIDTPMTAKGEIIPTDDKHLHFGKGQTETKLKLTPGKHTLTLLFADGVHRSYGEMMSQTITVNVK